MVKSIIVIDFYHAFSFFSQPFRESWSVHHQGIWPDDELRQLWTYLMKLCIVIDFCGNKPCWTFCSFSFSQCFGQNQNNNFQSISGRKGPTLQLGSDAAEAILGFPAAGVPGARPVCGEQRRAPHHLQCLLSVGRVVPPGAPPALAPQVTLAAHPCAHYTQAHG